MIFARHCTRTVAITDSGSISYPSRQAADILTISLHTTSAVAITDGGTINFPINVVHYAH